MADTDKSPSPKPRKRGRPKGKRSNPNYCLCCGYVKLKTFRAVKKRLFRQEKEMSELLQELLDRWLIEQKQ